MDDLQVVGARTHNLKSVCVSIPHRKITVVTGPSGSGKSSLAFDTVYAESQRRYFDALSGYARQFLEKLEKPEIDAMTGVIPALAIDQRALVRSMRSTVGTVTGMSDVLRLAFARLGSAHCPTCDKPILAQTQEQMMSAILDEPEGTRFTLFAPIARGRRGELRIELARLRKEGFVRVRLDGMLLELADDILPDAKKSHDLDVLIDRLTVASTARVRLSDSLALALKMGEGRVLFAPEGQDERWLSERFSCTDCGTTLPEVEPRLFSFNHPHGACPMCSGLGVSDPKAEDIDEEVDLSEVHAGNTCRACKGTRLRPEALAFTLNDLHIAAWHDLPLTALPVQIANTLAALGSRAALAEPLLAVVERKAGLLAGMGVGYLAMGRGTTTLSRGEAQRVRLATQMGIGLSGVLYVLDEPSAGLHPADLERLLHAERALCDQGNTVLIVEHERTSMASADHLIDMGPGAGANGGTVLAAGTPDEVRAQAPMGTYAWIDGKLRLGHSPRVNPKGWLTLGPVSEHNLKSVTLTLPLGAISVVTGVSGSGKSSLVLGALVPAARTLVLGKPAADSDADSGSGRAKAKKCKLQISGGALTGVVYVDQRPLARSPRSNLASVTGIFDLLREAYAGLPESRVRGYKASRFSFNVKGGRCEVCKGDGAIRVEMAMLADVFVPCETCKGTRFNAETLDVKYRDRTMADTLALSVDEAYEVYAAHPKIRQRLAPLRALGLGYLQLGNRASELSGGEAQRVRLARELGRKSGERLLYVLDEACSGLHYSDIDRLLVALYDLRAAGHTVVLVEHHMDVAARADWVVDLGPGAGPDGGKIMAAGTPDEVAASKGSVSAPYLTEALKRMHSARD